jgi:hypothetical protein
MTPRRNSSIDHQLFHQMVAPNTGTQIRRNVIAMTLKELVPGLAAALHTLADQNLVSKRIDGLGFIHHGSHSGHEPVGIYQSGKPSSWQMASISSTV